MSTDIHTIRLKDLQLLTHRTHGIPSSHHLPDQFLDDNTLAIHQAIRWPAYHGHIVFRFDVKWLDLRSEPF